MSAEAIGVVAVPEAHQRLVEKVLTIGGEEIRSAYDQRPEGALVLVMVIVDDHKQPTQIKDTDLAYMTGEEIADQDPSARHPAEAAVKLAASAGIRAALFVVQDEQGSAIAVHSIEPHTGTRGGGRLYVD